MRRGQPFHSLVSRLGLRATTSGAWLLRLIPRLGLELATWLHRDRGLCADGIRRVVGKELTVVSSSEAASGLHIPVNGVSDSLSERNLGAEGK